MKYKVELLCDRMGQKVWERSWSYPAEYTLRQTRKFLALACNRQYAWRIVPLPVQATSYAECITSRAPAKVERRRTDARHR
jgi:hypothetical protein